MYRLCYMAIQKEYYLNIWFIREEIKIVRLAREKLRFFYCYIFIVYLRLITNVRFIM